MTTTAVRERPIIFNGPMVRAILDGRKTQTRRVLKPHPPEDITNRIAYWTDSGELCGFGKIAFDKDGRLLWPPEGLSDSSIRCPYGGVGDRLWVRETWCQKCDDGTFVYNSDGNLDPSCFWYEADGTHVIKDDGDGGTEYRKDGREASPWISSARMPRWASRITLEITEVRVQRLQDISHSDCFAEGHPTDWNRSQDQSVHMDAAKDWFIDLWDSINAKRGFGSEINPWVRAITFMRLEQ